MQFIGIKIWNIRSVDRFENISFQIVSLLTKRKFYHDKSSHSLYTSIRSLGLIISFCQSIHINTMIKHWWIKHTFLWIRGTSRTDWNKELFFIKLEYDITLNGKYNFKKKKKYVIYHRIRKNLLVKLKYETW
jgi:hypothetical protein